MISSKNKVNYQYFDLDLNCAKVNPLKKDLFKKSQKSIQTFRHMIANIKRQFFPINFFLNKLFQ